MLAAALIASLLEIDPIGAQDVRCTNCGPGLVEWLGAVGGVVGGAAAIIALVLAKSSARDSRQAASAAKRSAAAAEAELVLFKAEVEEARRDRARRADLRVVLGARVTSSMTAGEVTSVRVVLDLGLANVGNRTAERVAVDLLAPKNVQLEQAGEIRGRLSHTASGDVGRGSEPCNRWNAVLGPSDPQLPHVEAQVRLPNRTPGESVPLVVKVIHPDIPNGERREYWRVDVSPNGRTATATRNEPASTIA